MVTAINSNFTALSPSILSLVGDNIAGLRTTLTTLIDAAISGVFDRLRTSVAPCSVVWDVVLGFVDIPCGSVIDPLHGYFFGFGAHCMLGIVAIILAVKVAGLLREEANFRAGGEDAEGAAAADPKRNQVSPTPAPAPEDQVFSLQQQQSTAGYEGYDYPVGYVGGTGAFTATGHA